MDQDYPRGESAPGWTLAHKALAQTKTELRQKFGDRLYRSYIESLDLAGIDDEEILLVARYGHTQSLWLNAEAKTAILDGINRHMDRMRPIRICALHDLPPTRQAQVSARAVVNTPPVERSERPAWRGRFETFAEGPANKRAVLLARLIASRAAGAHRLVVFLGEPGVGKTHLVEAIANGALDANPQLEVRLINGQKFTEDFVDAVARKKDASGFKSAVREADILIIDDVPRVAGRSKTEEELFDAIQAVQERGGVVVMTAATSASGFAAFGDRLAHHLNCATQCEIDLPDVELRRAILDARVGTYAEEHPGFAVEAAALDMIAQRMPVSGRELDGAVRQLMLEWLDTRAPITADVAEHALRAKFTERDRKVTVDMIKAATAQHYQMTVAELMRKTREKAVSHPRQVAMYLTTQETTLSLPNIARLFGGYDHTTVLFARKKVARLLGERQDLQRDVEAIRKLLRKPH